MLELNSIDITYDGDIYGTINCHSGDLNITVYGNCTVTNTKSGFTAISGKNNVSVTGTGDLTLNADNYVIYSNQGITVNLDGALKGIYGNTEYRVYLLKAIESVTVTVNSVT